MERLQRIQTSLIWNFKGEGEYSDNKFLMNTPFSIIIILIGYLWFVLRFGPKYMKTRAPYDLRNWLFIYNAGQVLISLAMFAQGFPYLFTYGLWHKPCYCEHPDLMKLVVDGSHYYFLSKVIELLDTVFFVLRKKQKQVSFLHVYHHTIMVIATWSIVKYSKTDTTVFLGLINSLVHIIMYSYYGLSVFPQLAKFLWWKKYITQLQLIQFSLMFLHVVVSHFVSDCKPAYFLLTSVCFNTVLFMYLFGDFYIKSYNKSRQTHNSASIKTRKVSADISGKKYGMNIIKSNRMTA